MFINMPIPSRVMGGGEITQPLTRANECIDDCQN